VHINKVREHKDLMHLESNLQEGLLLVEELLVKNGIVPNVDKLIQ
jgi:hypothetical protein